MPYNEDSILTYGKHKSCRIRDIPEQYLITLYWNRGSPPDLQLKEYMERVYDIKSGNVWKRKEIAIPEPPKKGIPLCPKMYWPTQKAAKEALKKIRESKGDHKKPIRTYECPFCSGWHLTSIPMEIFKSK